MKLVLVLAFVLACLSTVSAVYEGLYCGKRTCYEVLELPRDAPKKKISKAYRKLQFKFHPDRQGEISAAERERLTKEMELLLTAYETLKDDKARKEYDHLLDNPDEFYRLWFKEHGHKQKFHLNGFLVVIALLTAISAGQKALVNSGIEHKLKDFLEEELIRNRYVTRACDEGHSEKVRGAKGKILDKGEVKAAIIDLYEEELMELTNVQRMEWSDTLWMKVIYAPVTLPKWIMETFNFHMKYTIGGQEFPDDEKERQTMKVLNINEKVWKKFSEEERADKISQELWKSENMKKYLRKQQEAIEQEYIKKYKKKGGKMR